MSHALARTPLGFGAARFALGLGEAGNFPAAIKSTAEWFPKKERALATGIFNSGANVGAVVAPLLVPWLTLTFGWPAAFVATGLLGFIWLAFWVGTYEKPELHRRLSRRELDHILSDPPEASTAKTSWREILKLREAWAFIIAKFLTDPIWWFYLYWLPKLLNERYGLGLADIGLPLIAVYTMTTFGSIGGGWLSSTLIKKGVALDRARKTVMLIAACLIVPVFLAAKVSSLWLTVLLVGLAAAAHQGWSANLFTTSSDMFPKRAVGSIVGLGGMAGSLGGMLFATATGYVLEWTGSYLPLLILAGSVYLLALLIFHLLVPKIRPVEF
jgi:ACS family hexuronate transporter-like MFS transporter